MPNRRRFLLILPPLAVLIAGTALAQDDVARRAWQVQWENDTFAGTDENYTNGLRVSFMHHPEFAAETSENLARRWCARLCPDLDYDVIDGWSIGQNFYTPEDITQVAQIPGERPWAGWLYGGFLLQLTETKRPEGEKRSQHSFEATVGVTGRPALAEPVQKGVHELIGSEKPLGWDNQLAFEPTLGLNYLYRRILKSSARFDVTPHFGGNLGNVQTYLNAGATVRFGRGISGFPVQIIASTEIAAEERPKSEWYFFAGADGRVMAHNFFLDGNTFESSYSVPSDTFVYDVRAGFSYRRGNWRFTYTAVRRSEEFPPPPNQEDGIHRFASVSISFEPIFLN